MLTYHSLWRAVIFLSLVPTLLLWPALHLHPALKHADGLTGSHTHPAVVHADFFPSSADDHTEHHDSQNTPDDTTPRPLTEIHLPALSVRHPPPPAPTRECLLDAATLWHLLAALAPHPFVGARDHTPLLLDFALLPLSPRSPPLPV
jgi:hypothetical protein